MSNTSEEDTRRAKGRVAGVYGRRIRLARWVFGLLLVACIGLWFAVHRVAPLLSDPDEKCGSTASAHAYLVVQMLFANGDPACTEGPILQVLRLLAPWILPLLGVVTVVSSLRVRLDFFRRTCIDFLRRCLSCQRRELVLVIGLGQKGMEMVRAELGRGASVVVIEPDEDNPRIVQAETEGAQVWVGDGLSQADLKTAAWKRPARIWIMTGDSRRNLLILDVVTKEFKLEKESASRLDVHALVPEFRERRDAMRLKTLNDDRSYFWTHVFNQEEAFAEWLIRQNPVRPRDGQPPRILLVGLGPLGRAIHRELLLMCHYPDPQELAIERQPQAVLVDAAAASFHELDEELPFLRRPIPGVSPFMREERLEEDAQGWVFEHYRSLVRKEGAFTHVFICMGSEVRNLALAERIAGWERLIERDHRTRIVPVVYDDEAAKWSKLGTDEDSSRRLIHPFKISSVYESDALKWRNETLQGMAKRINHVYDLALGKQAHKDQKPEVWADKIRELARGGERWRQRLARLALRVESLALDAASETDGLEQSRKAAQDESWRKAVEDERRSSLAQARYLCNRFLGDGSGSNGVDSASWNETLPEAIDACIQGLDLEARCEHRRWNAFMLVENFGRVALANPETDYELWKPSCDENVEEAKGERRRKFARVNLNLMPFADLPPDAKRIDIHIVAAQEWIKRGNEALE